MKFLGFIIVLQSSIFHPGVIGSNTQIANILNPQVSKILSRQHLRITSPGVQKVTSGGKKFFSEARNIVPNGYLDQLLTGAEEVRPALRKFVGRGNKAMKTIRNSIENGSKSREERQRLMSDQTQIKFKTKIEQAKSLTEEEIEKIREYKEFLKKQKEKKETEEAVDEKKKEEEDNEKSRQNSESKIENPKYKKPYQDVYDDIVDNTFYARDVYDELYGKS